jgi:hypothetical protein
VLEPTRHLTIDAPRPALFARRWYSLRAERHTITWAHGRRLKRGDCRSAFAARGSRASGSVVGVPLPYHFRTVMGDIGKPIRETERPAPVRVPVPEPEPEREAPPPQREPEPVEAQRA